MAGRAVPQPRLLPLSQHHRVRRRRADIFCLSSIFELRTTLKDGVESISSSVFTTAAAHVARVRGEEQGTRYLERTGETQRPYSERAERETLNFYISP